MQNDVLQTDRLSAEYRQGLAAYRRGAQPEDCPYPQVKDPKKTSLPRFQWFSGYWCGKSQDDRMKRKAAKGTRHGNPLRE